MAYYATIVTVLGTLALVAVALALGLMVAISGSTARARLVGVLAGQVRHPIGWAWCVALIAMAGSLYLSEIAHLIPCSFCWYQRIAMYPLVVVLGVAMVRGDVGAWRYGLPLSVIGLLIAAYHVTIQWLPSLDVGACSVGAPCSGRYLAVYGFISIPTMAGAAFSLISALMLLVRVLETEAEGPSTEPHGG